MAARALLPTTGSRPPLAWLVGAGAFTLATASTAGVIPTGASAVVQAVACAAALGWWAGDQRHADASPDRASDPTPEDDGLRRGRPVLATGAGPVPPPTEGPPLPGVHLLRTADDALAARAETGSHPDLRDVVVLGAGPLGVETAIALTEPGVRVTLVDQGPRPLPGLVDERAGELVRVQLTTLGVTVQTGVTVLRAYGVSRVAAIGLSDGRQLPCDLLLVCTGVRPNVELSRSTGLPVVKQLPSKVPQSQPGPAVVRLDLSGMQVVSIGRTEPRPDDQAVIALDQPAQRRYRKIIVTADGTVQGGIVVNDPDAVAAIESAVTESAATGLADVRPHLAGTLTGTLADHLLAAGTAPTRRHINPLVPLLAAAVVLSALAAVSVALLLGGDEPPRPAPARSPLVLGPSGSGRASSPAPAPSAMHAPRALATAATAAGVLEHPRISWAGNSRRVLATQDVEPRLLALLVALAADHKITVAELPDLPGDAGGVPRRVVAISSVDGAAVTTYGGLNELTAWFEAQQAPYRPVDMRLTWGDPPALLVALDASVPTRPATP